MAGQRVTVSGSPALPGPPAERGSSQPGAGRVRWGGPGIRPKAEGLLRCGLLTEASGLLIKPPTKVTTGQTANADACSVPPPRGGTCRRGPGKS